jgi:hypothetical protein
MRFFSDFLAESAYNTMVEPARAVFESRTVPNGQYSC